MGDYQANSHKSKAQITTEKSEERKVQKVVTKKAKTRKNEGRKLMGIFISEDVADVKSRVFMDFIVPTVKKTISDVVVYIVDTALFGESHGRKSGTSAGRVSYRSYYDDRRDDRRSPEPRVRNRFDYDDIVVPTRGDAEAVIEQMDELIDRYGFVTVADMYDMVDLTAPYTANKYGWTNIRSAEPVRLKDGYTIKLPKAMPID